MNSPIRQDVSLAEYTTLQVGGNADYFIQVNTVEELKLALQFAQQNTVPVFVLGGGSNVLFSDTGYRGLVIKNNIKGLDYRDNNHSVLLTCGAGEIFDAVVEDSGNRGFWGLENLSAIPGTVGATPVQNVGAYGVEVSTLIKEVQAIAIDTLVEKSFSTDDCRFAYRDSYFKTAEGRKWIITSVSFQLSVVAKPVLSYGALQKLSEEKTLSPVDVRQVVCAVRAGKFPDWRVVGTAGSFFKNPVIRKEDFKELFSQYPDLPVFTAGSGLVKISLGWLLEHVCNLRGYCRDGVCLYEKQALVLVNTAGASAKEIDSFAEYVTGVVKEKTGVDIEREVRSV